MPYIVKKGKGKRPYKIIKQKTGEIVGTSISLKAAWASIAHREEGEKQKKKRT